MKTFSLAAFLLLLLVSLPARSTDYAQAPGSSLEFIGKYYDTPFKGKFPGFNTRLSFDPTNLAEATLDVSIPLMGANTGNADYDNQMHSTAFFDTKHFPQARYSARRFRHLDGNRYAADGTLTLRGVSHPVTLTFTWKPGAKAILTGQATVQRSAFGVGSGALVDAGILPSDIPDDIQVRTKVVLKPAAP